MAKLGLYNNRKAVNSRFKVLGKRGGRISDTIFSSWNIRSGLNQEAVEKIAWSLGRDNVDFCALQEVRREGLASMDISVMDHEKGMTYDYTMLYSGHEKQGHHGVGIMISARKMKFLTDWGCNGKFPERIMWCKFEGCNIISFYGFTEAKPLGMDVETHEELYAELESVYKSLSHLIVPKKGLKRSRGRPKFRLIDAIKDDLEDIANIDYKRMEALLQFDSKMSRAEKIISICQLWEIERNQNTN